MTSKQRYAIAGGIGGFVIIVIILLLRRDAGDTTIINRTGPTFGDVNFETAGLPPIDLSRNPFDIPVVFLGNGRDTILTGAGCLGYCDQSGPKIYRPAPALPPASPPPKPFPIFGMGNLDTMGSGFG